IQTHFVFINIYAHNSPVHRAQLLRALNGHLKNYNSNSVVIVGGDWNCTIHPLDRNSVEPHPRVASLLDCVLRENDLIDTWRQCHPGARQYSWVRAGGGSVSAARLDRLNNNQTHCNKVKRAQ
uniref:Endonuclease/exonuclease/phosphatase domain-containing protein n=1 Tax=Neogobius melanostomus TaxID=47308 RepID=A0A8C6SBB0_9GOBI